ncbi:MAG: hypothetical protein ACJ757_00305 [Gaiellaceae bacterium]
MRAARTLAPLVAALLAAATAGAVDDAHPAAASTCGPRWATAAYTGAVRQAVSSGRDLWGERLLSAPGGPTYAAAQRYLTPLLHAVQRRQGPLTPSGFYYVPLSFSFTSYGSTVFALHVADGSEIVTRHVGGPSLSVYVGKGNERYGSCEARLHPARLVDGYLPIVQTSYVDAAGVRYTQESFVGRSYGAFGARSVISFVKLHVDARRARAGATVRLVPWKRLAHTAPDRLALRGATRLIASDGAAFVQGVVRYRVARGETATVYAEWLNKPSDARYVRADAKTYDAARNVVASFWTERLATGARFDVPEPAVQNAQLGILSQQIAFGWRYSVGNPYEELSFAEALDSAEVAATYGYPSVAKSIIEFSLNRLKRKPKRFTTFRAGHILSTAAFYYRLTHDRTFARKATPELHQLVDGIARRQIRSGPRRGRLEPEPLSSDIPYSVESVVAPIEAWQGLLAMGRVWSLTGSKDLAERARTLALGISGALRPPLRREMTRLRDGSLFVPDALTGPRGPFDRLTATREGSYWNLMMPYALASGFFPAHSSAARGIVRYVLGHGSRLLGVPRADAHIVYANKPYGSGLGQVYGLSMSRFLSDNDHPDKLVLSLYGMLAIGMTPGTYVSGEAISVVPVNGAYERSMYMPPNAGGNASYLETFHQTLIHERRGRYGAPTGLDLAFATPRAWLADGKDISVTDAPTSFGTVSYSLSRRGGSVDIHLVLPAHAHARLRIRLPAGERVSGVSLGSRRLPFASAATVDLSALHGALTLHAAVRR